MKKRESKIKRSLKYSILDGAFYSAMLSFGDSFFAAFAVFLKATTFQLGVLGSLPQAIGSLSQIFANKLLEFFKSRKRFILFVALLEGLMYLPITLVYFFGEMRIYLLILFVCIYWIFGVIISPAWNSWMGDLVPEKERGVYFGRRNRIAGFVSFATFLIAGYILQVFSKNLGIEYIGFVVLFSLAVISRLISIYFLTKEYEPEYKLDEALQFTFIEFLKRARFTNYGLFVFYLGAMYFAIYLASPFLTPYMLTELKMGYEVFVIITTVSLAARFLSMPAWGKIADKYGTIKVLTVTGLLMPIVPLLWIFSKNLWYLVAIQLYAGFVWAGFDISSFNFIFDSTSKEKRTTCVAYYNLTTGILTFLGAMLGSLLIQYTSLSPSKYYVAFVASFVLRYAISFAFLPKIHEIRHVQKISYSNLLIKVIRVMPPMGIIHNLIVFAEDGIKGVRSKGKKNGSRDYKARGRKKGGAVRVRKISVKKKIKRKH